MASLTLAGCGNNDDSEPSASESSSGSSADVCKDADGSGPKVGMAYDVGGRGDQSFNDSASPVWTRPSTSSDATCIEGEATDGETESAREERLRDIAEAGYNPIIAVGFAYSDAVNAVAPDYPDTNFAVDRRLRPRRQGQRQRRLPGFAENQGSFLVGVAAALKTEGRPRRLRRWRAQRPDQEVRGRLHRRCPRPSTRTSRSTSSTSRRADLAGFGDPADGKTAATGMFDNGADIVYHAAGGSGSGVFEAAAEAGDGKWAIGVDSDQYLTASCRPAAAHPHLDAQARRRGGLRLDQVDRRRRAARSATRPTT